MRVKSIVNLVLGLFVVAAVALVARQSIGGRSAEPAPLPAPVSSASALPVTPVPVAAEAAPPADLSPAAPAVTTTEVSEQVATAPVQPAEQTKPRAAKPQIANEAKQAPKHKIVAMYFHGDVRCATCRKVEAYAKEAVEEGFKAQMAAGLVEFRAVNVDQAENKHFVQDYQLMNKSVVVADEIDGAVTRWVKLDNVWGLVGDRDAYLLYVQDAVRLYVEN